MQGEDRQRPLPTSRSAQLRRARIVTAGYELLLDSDYEHVQIRDVADRAGVALATVYRHFPSKERLFAEVLVRWYEERWRRLGAADLGSSNRERLTNMALQIVSAYEQQPQFMGLMRVLEQSGDVVIKEHIASINQRASQPFRAGLSGLPENVEETIATLMVLLVRGMVGRCIRDGRSMEPARALISHSIELLLEFRDPALPGSEQSP